MDIQAQPQEKRNQKEYRPMARARLLATAIAEDPDLAKLTIEAELLYLHAIPHLDRDGLITGSPILLWAKTAPQRVNLMEKAGQYIEEWVSVGLVIRYKGADGPALFFKGFRKHNSNMAYHREEPSKFPPPPGWTRTRQGIVPDDEEACFRLLIAFDARSSYRKELESRIGRDLLATLSRSGIDEDQDQDQVQDQDQDQVQDQVQDQLDDVDDGFLLPLVLLDWSKKINTHNHRVLTQAMRTLAASWMYAADWQGYRDYLKHADDEKLSYLLCWLAQLPDNCFDVFEWRESPAFQNATKPVGLIKYHIETSPKHPKPTDPGLNRRQYAALAAYALWDADRRDESKSDVETNWMHARWDYIGIILPTPEAVEEPTQ
jgi:hypothetical protein